jgi:PPOX class probable F420-dependent enzyme
MVIGPDEKCVLLTTFKRDGTGVATPVWWVDMGDGTFGFWTSSASGKAKRLAHTPRVTVQPCSQRGVLKPGTSPEEATARLVTGAQHEEIRQRVIAKYGFWTKVTKALAKFAMALRGKPSFPYGDRGVIVTLGAVPPTP